MLFSQTIFILFKGIPCFINKNICSKIYLISSSMLSKTYTELLIFVILEFINLGVIELSLQIYNSSLSLSRLYNKTFCLEKNFLKKGVLI